MRIAFFADTYYPHLNGVTTSVEALADGLRKKGHIVYIFAPSIRGYKDTDDYAIRLPSVGLLPSLPEAIRAPLFFPNKGFRKLYHLSFDIVHAHGNGAFSFMGYQVARLQNIPYVLTFHTQLMKYTHYILNGRVIKPKMAARFMRMFSYLCDGVIAPSEKMRQELVACGIQKEIVVIPTFVELERFQDPKPHFLHKLIGLSKETPILLSVGRLGREKKFEFVMRVFKKIMENDRKTHLVIVGYGREKPYLIRYAKSLGILKRTHFTGKIEQHDIPSVYHDATVFVFASDTETQGVCVQEAAVSGLPLVLVKDRAFEQLVENGKNGYSLELDEDKFAEKTLYLLENESVRTQFGIRSQKIAQKFFKEDSITDHLINYYQILRLRKKRQKRFLTRTFFRLLQTYKYFT